MVMMMVMMMMMLTMEMAMAMTLTMANCYEAEEDEEEDDNDDDNRKHFMVIIKIGHYIYRHIALVAMVVAGSIRSLCHYLLPMVHPISPYRHCVMAIRDISVISCTSMWRGSVLYP